MSNVRDFLPFVLPDVPGCPGVLATQKILEAARDFCERSHYWQYEHGDIAVTAGSRDYVAIPPTDAMVVTVLEPIMHDSEPCYFKTRSWLGKNDVKWNTRTKLHSDYFYADEPGQIKLASIPEVDGTLSGITLVLKPTPASSTIPDLIYNDYYSAIAAGAVSLLLRMNNKEWHNQGTAQVKWAEFENKVSEAKAKRKAGYKTENRNTRISGHYY